MSLDRIGQQITGPTPCQFYCRLDGSNHTADVWRDLIPVYRSCDGSTSGVAQDHDEWHPQILDGILDTGQDHVVHDVAGNPDHKQTAESLVENDFRGDPRIRTT